MQLEAELEEKPRAQERRHEEHMQSMFFGSMQQMMGAHATQTYRSSASNSLSPQPFSFHHHSVSNLPNTPSHTPPYISQTICHSFDSDVDN